MNADYSGCKDEQTSADVYDVSSFGLPKDSGPGGAGGACTSAIIRSLSKYLYPCTHAQHACAGKDSRSTRTAFWCWKRASDFNTMQILPVDEFSADNPNQTWVQLLESMRKILKEKK